MKTIENEYFPDFVSTPGDALEDVLENLSISQKELASRMGRPIKTINEIIKGKTAIVPDTAIQLEKVLGTSSEFWLAREADYQNYLAKKKELEKLKNYTSWLTDFPFKGMMDFNFIPDPGTTKVNRVDALLKFFGVASPKQWEESWDRMNLSFKKSEAFNSSSKATSAWLRMGELLARNVESPEYSKEIFFESLEEIKKLVPIKEITKFKNELIELCRKSGVILVFVPALKGVPISGVARWINPKKALIQLSLRHKTDDHLWFAFFHEACHILKHQKKCIYVELSGKGVKDEHEIEADNFARNFLIKDSAWERFVNNGVFDENSIKRFSSEHSVSPGIVVGRLQHDKIIPYSSLNNMKVRYEWRVSGS